MKNTFVFLLFCCFTLTGFSQGWRPNEKEIKIFLHSESEGQKLGELNLDLEPVSLDGTILRAYVTDTELQKINEHHFSYQIIIPDLNKHYLNFWKDHMVPNGYYTYEQIIEIADSLATNFPTICKKVIWGTSMGGRQLAALKISDNVNTDEPEPEIMFDGGIHGDEVGGAQNIILFARDLCTGYGNDQTITDLINSREIWLYLMVNPDGRVSMSRYNNNMVDCNRDAGYMWNGEGNSTGAFSQVETKALRNCIFDNQFVVYTNYHSGTVTLSFPWSYRSNQARDYVHINQIASAYAATSGYTNLQYGQGYNIMYAINGSTKDTQYGSLGNVGWSIEISTDKQPPSSQIMTFYNDNKPAMLEIIKECGWGVSGIVTDSLTGEPVRATIWVNNYFPVYTDPEVGDYHKFVVPGTYSLKVTANGYQTKTITGINVPNQNVAITDFQLVPYQKYNAEKVMSCRIPGNNFGDEGFTPGCLGEADSIPYSLGKNGWITIDMGDTIYDGPGYDFKVIQNGIPLKPFTVSGGNSKDGPFTTIGTGTGTTSFDLMSAQLGKVRYLYIKDNGSGSSYGQRVGFNLDAIEMITPPLIVKFSSSSDTLCAKTTINFEDHSLGNPSSWIWSFPGGIPSSSTSKNPENIQYDVPGSYNVTLTISNGVSSTSKIITNYINVFANPDVCLGNDTTICSKSSLTLNAGNPGASFLWSTGETTQIIRVDSTGVGNGTQNYWVAVTNTSNCTVSDTIAVTYDPCTGIEPNNTTPSVMAFPNPTQGKFSLHITGFNKGSWQLFSLSGQLLKSSTILNDDYTCELNGAEFPQGICILLVSNNLKTVEKKIIIL
ncbi:MAG: carboxypeptidase regulatory-like domain-containing protein [Bacteroidales bacterium]|nr:carboxypeptidase regulatory-like domain-containing protein [Bacteroidales bacterium]